MKTDFLSEWKNWFSEEDEEQLILDRLESMVASYLWPRIELPEQPKSPRRYVEEALEKLKKKNPMEEWHGSEHVAKYVLQTAINQIKDEIRASQGRVPSTKTKENETKKRHPKIPVLPENWALVDEPTFPTIEILEEVNKRIASNPVLLEVIERAKECWREKETEDTEGESDNECSVTVKKPKKGIMQFPVTDIIEKSGLAPAVVASAVKQIRNRVGIDLAPALELFRNGGAKSFSEAMEIVQQRKRAKKKTRI